MFTVVSTNSTQVAEWNLVRCIAISALYNFLKSKDFAVDVIEITSIKAEQEDFNFLFTVSFRVAEQFFSAEVCYWHAGVLHDMYRFLNSPESGDYLTIHVVPVKLQMMLICVLILSLT